jgi:putative ABC transport system substrate-binding protein
MRRRDFIAGLGGAASWSAWPRAASAQQSTNRMRRIGVLMAESEGDPQSQRRVVAFQDGLSKLGWLVGRTVQIDYRWAAGDIERTKHASVELLGLAPDVIVATASTSAAAVQQVSRTVPIVFIGISEPIAQGFVTSLARPGGNMTGFTNLEWTFGTKWLEVLREIAPNIGRAAIMFNPQTAPYAASFLRSAETLAARLKMEVFAATVGQPADFEATMMLLAREPRGGLIVPPDIFTATHRKLIVDLAARYRLPAIYAFRFFTADGGLASYGVDIFDIFRLAAGYVDRILKGEKPADLPVQQPTKFETVVNLKTAKTLGLDIPATLLARADEVIE